MLQPLILVITAILILLLTISVVLNVILYRYAKQYYLQLNETRLDPPGVIFYKPSDPPADKLSQPKIKVVFFGDSRAYQWPEPENLSQFIFLNRGIGAQTSSQVVERYETQISPLQPDIVVVQVCINDLKTIPLYPHLKRQIKDKCKENLKHIVDKSRSLGANVILTTIFPLGKLPLKRRLFWSDEVAEAIVEVNEYVETLQNEGVIIYDTVAILADQSGQVRAEYRDDFLHLNENGYQVLNEGLEKLLLKIEAKKAFGEK